MTAPVRHRAVAATAPDRARGRTALLLLACAGFPSSGLVFVASYGAANRGAGGVHELYWAATAIALATTAGVYLLLPDRRCVAVLAVVMGGLLSLPKFLRAPHYFNFYDELAHWRATQGLLEGDPLFAANPLNKVVADYPGLDVLTATVSAVTGGSVFATGNLVILLARVAGCLAVYLLAEKIVRVPAAALLAVLVFVANPAFAFFDAQFAYESLAAPLVAVVLLLGLRPVLEPTPVFLAAALVSLAVVITHHGSSYVLTGALMTMLLMSALTRNAPSRHLWALTGAVLAATVGWLLTAGHHTLTYVGPLIRSNLASIPEFMTGSNRPRRLFGGLLPAPAYEQVAGFVAAIVLFGLFCWGALILLRRHRVGDRVAAWVSVLLGTMYFLSLPLVVLRADQVAKRLWGFAFIGLAAVCGAALASLAARHRGVGRAAVAALLAIVTVGSGVARSGEHIRFPGGYLPSADPRSLTPDVVAAAEWLLGRHGPDHRVAGDRTLAAALGSYGMQRPITYQENGRAVWRIFQPDRLGPDVLEEIQRSGLEWIAVDLRAAGVSPLTGFYFDESEPGAYVDTSLTTRGLTKFDGAGFRRAYDNGHVVLYLVGAP